MKQILSIEEIEKEFPKEHLYFRGGGRKLSPESEELSLLPIGKGIVWSPCPVAHMRDKRGPNCSLAERLHKHAQLHHLVIRTWHKDGAFIVIRKG